MFSSLEALRIKVGNIFYIALLIWASAWENVWIRAWKSNSLLQSPIWYVSLHMIVYPLKIQGSSFKEDKGIAKRGTLRGRIESPFLNWIESEEKTGQNGTLFHCPFEGATASRT